MPGNGYGAAYFSWDCAQSPIGVGWLAREKGWDDGGQSFADPCQRYCTASTP